ncbi:MerC domain-containing protein [Novosphingobium sp. NPDC080210]|uniref:MerC domain-containing protein n=1 Tax=Novosphingobium sp. NPDC080210 TaxID=3390596 RepID=UPI003D02BBC0
MRAAIAMIRNRLDRMGILLSALCALHCLAGILLVAGLGVGGEFLFAPSIHRIGLALAIVIGGITLAIGIARHGDPRPLQIGALGLGLMVVALAVGHGASEAVLTIGGVSLLAWAHLRNLRLSNCATCD